MLDSYLKALDLCYFEVGEAFKGLSDENVWKRPNPKLLSVGELAGHMAYWEAVRYAGENEDGSASRDLSNCKISSPLLDERFGYYFNRRSRSHGRATRLNRRTGCKRPAADP